MRYLWRTYQPPTDKIMNPSHLRTLLLSISVLLLLTVSPILLAQTPSDQYECLYRYHYSGPTTSAEEGDSGLDIMVAIMSAQEQHNESLPQELSTLVMLRMGDQRSYCRDYTAYRVDSLMAETTDRTVFCRVFRWLRWTISSTSTPALLWIWGVER